MRNVRATGAFLVLAVRPLKGLLPTVMEIPTTIMWLGAVVLNTAMNPSSEEALTENLLGFLRANRWAVLAATLALLFLIAGVRTESERQSERTPRLYFKRIACGPTTSMWRREQLADPNTLEIKGERTVATQAWIVGAIIVNDPPTFHQDAAVGRAIVHVEFFDDANPDQLLWQSAQGVWGDNPAPASSDRGIASEVFCRRDLPANGEEHRIDVAAKLEGSPNVIPWCVPYMRDTNAHPDGFGPGTYQVAFTVKGEGLRAPFTRRFRIINPKDSEKLVVEKLHYLTRKRWWSWGRRGGDPRIP